MVVMMGALDRHTVNVKPNIVTKSMSILNVSYVHPVIWLHHFLYILLFYVDQPQLNLTQRPFSFFFISPSKRISKSSYLLPWHDNWQFQRKEEGKTRSKGKGGKENGARSKKRDKRKIRKEAEIMMLFSSTNINKEL